MNYVNNLIKKITKKKISIGVIGLGYVGLPLSVLFAKKKIKILGFDLDKNKLNLLRNNRTYIERIKPNDIRIINKNFGSFHYKFEKIKECDFIVICVPTPLRKNEYPDLRYVKKTIKLIFNFLRPGQILVLESTSYPGTTRELIINKIKNKFDIGKNFFIGFSSERINPGFNENKIENVPKVVSGYTSNCLRLISNVYKIFFKKIVKSKSIEIAEYSKLLENIYRSVNIGFINEMKFIADKMGMDIFEILKIAKTKPYGFRPFKPGPGIGGHCIPIDPNYLYWKANKVGIKANFIKLSSTTNKKVIKFIKNKILLHLRQRKLKKNRAKILILGLAYKQNIDDVRESSSLEIINELLKEKIHFLRWSDPHVKKFVINKNKKEMNKSIMISKNSLLMFDLVVLLTDHDKFDYKKILKFSKHIIDCRGRFPTSLKVTRG